MDKSHHDILRFNGGDPRSQTDARYQDRSIVDFIGDIYKFEFHEFQKQTARDGSLNLDNIKFHCDCPPNTGDHLHILQHKWTLMWNATKISTDGAPTRYSAVHAHAGALVHHGGGTSTLLGR
jgi:hypothetical protein